MLCLYLHQNLSTKTVLQPHCYRTVPSSSSHNGDAIPMGQVFCSSTRTFHVTTSRPSTPAIRIAETEQQNYSHAQTYQPQTQLEPVSSCNAQQAHREFIQEAPPPYDSSAYSDDTDKPIACKVEE